MGLAVWLALSKGLRVQATEAIDKLKVPTSLPLSSIFFFFLNSSQVSSLLLSVPLLFF